MAYHKPRLLLSRCINTEACRYNGDIVHDAFVRQLAPFAEIETVCPEVAIGLGVPRAPIRLVWKEDSIRLWQPETGRDLTEAMQQFSRDFCEPLNIDGAILKNRSPSCGIKDIKVYDRPAGGKEAGLFAKVLMARHPDAAIEDEGRLKNYRIREHFLTTVFTYARFRDVLAEQSHAALASFHESHKYLLMAYHQDNLKQLGQIVARGKEGLAESLNSYETILRQSFRELPHKGKIVNALQHVGGYFSHVNSTEEKAFLQELFTMYRQDQIPLSSLLLLIHGWALRDSNDYLIRQTLLNPYPKELMKLEDSGRIIEM